MEENQQNLERSGVLENRTHNEVYAKEKAWITRHCFYDELEQAPYCYVTQDFKVLRESLRLSDPHLHVCHLTALGCGKNDHYFQSPYIEEIPPKGRLG